MTSQELAMAFARRLRSNATYADAAKFSIANLSTMKVEDCHALAEWIEGRAMAGTGAVSAADAFEMGYVWRGQLQGQALEDSRAVGRTLLNPMFDRLKLDLSGFNSFDTADAGICDAKARILSALEAAPEPQQDEVKTYAQGLFDGWAACRKSIYAVCEDVDREANAAAVHDGEHAKAYASGMARAAKSIARGFNSMEATDDDNVAALLGHEDTPELSRPAPREGRIDV